MTPKVQQAINEQIKEEFYSAYLYLAIAAEAAEQNFSGLENWMKIQAQEELDHAMGFYTFLIGRGGKVELQALPAPDKKFGDLAAKFAAALEHEQYITGRINALVDLARSENDYALESFLKWYVDEQVEEEDTAITWLEKAKLAVDGSAQLFLDQELAKRVYTPGGPYATMG